MNRICMNIAGSALALAAAFGPLGAHAAVIYQSIPFLTAPTAINGWCSQCKSDGQNVGQFFTLGSGSVANTLTFVTTSNFFWPTSVTIDIFKDGLAKTLGENIYHHTFSTFASDTPTPNGTDVVEVNLGHVSLAAGSYDLFMYNTSNLGIPGFDGGAGHGIVENGGPGLGPSTGDHYKQLGLPFGFEDSGIQLSGAVPEPAAWAMLALGVGLIGFAARRRRSETAAATA